ncbi:hypothetical protein QCA50_004821 [Cerrena zonata]|uniref:Uncharacterized protein n=1 Tax=Cerrena zonata TaxID=2478898 RepID=A0AAW0GND7_9APHY
MPMNTTKFDTLISLPRSKFSDSSSSSERTTPEPPHTSLTSEPQQNHNLIPIPNRKHENKIFAWVDQTDPEGPGPNSPTQFTTPSPEYYPISIWTPQPTKIPNTEKHWWERTRQLRFLTREQLRDLVMGDRPVILCGGRAEFVTCKICRRRNDQLFVGCEANIGGNWGKGVITKITRQERAHVVVLVEGADVNTNSRTAKARIRIEMFHLSRTERLKCLYLRLSRNLREAASSPMVEPEPKKPALPGAPDADWKPASYSSHSYPPSFLPHTEAE